MGLTNHERRQRMDERNRLRRMRDCALELEISYEFYTRDARRYAILQERAEDRISEIEAELGFRGDNATR